MKIGYQGVPGSYSSLASAKFFGNTSFESFGYTTFKELVQALIDEDVDYIALPVENSTSGPITRTIDLMKYLEVSAVSEIYVKIDHALITKKETKFEDIQIVYSHPEALEQCITYLNEIEKLEIKEYHDTAGAVEMVKNSPLTNIAAVAGTHAAELYDMKVQRENISDNPLNTTRFLIFKKGREPYASHKEKTSIYVETEHSTGSLNEILNIFSKYHINLLYLMSRPIQKKAFSYGFFIDVERSEKGNLTTSLNEIREKSMYLNILGTYSPGEPPNFNS